MVPLDTLEFDQIDRCERCRKVKAICRTGICEDCLRILVASRQVPISRASMLAELNQSENGVIQAMRNDLRRAEQAPRAQFGLNFNKMLSEREHAMTAKLALSARAIAVIEASAQELAEARSAKGVQISLVGVNQELIRYLAAHPGSMCELHPRKFEEVVAEILKDQGHSVELTPKTRDGGRDIIALMKTPLGEMLVIVECKKWAPSNRVGVEIIERFLFTIREKDRANRGMIVTTTQFSPEAIKRAQEYPYLLRLQDSKALQQMASSYGNWQQYKDSQIWIPNY